MPADITIITSLYRAEAYLPVYTGRVLGVAAQVKAAGLALELALVANDPTDRERALISQLEGTLRDSGTATAIRLDVPREPLYA